MKSVLISIKPKWCELIVLGKKTVEVRKTRPAIEKVGDKFKCYIYMTKDIRFNTFHSFNAGKIIGEFVCDDVFDCIDVNMDDTCLTVKEWLDYSKGHLTMYGWHISDLVIYDEPKELSEFFYACDKKVGKDCSNCIDLRENKCKSITRPPQSWCYVEEINT